MRVQEEQKAKIRERERQRLERERARSSRRHLAATGAVQAGYGQRRRLRKQQSQFQRRQHLPQNRQQQQQQQDETKKQHKRGKPVELPKAARDPTPSQLACLAEEVQRLRDQLVSSQRANDSLREESAASLDAMRSDLIESRKRERLLRSQRDAALAEVGNAFARVHEFRTALAVSTAELTGLRRERAGDRVTTAALLRNAKESSVLLQLQLLVVFRFSLGFANSHTSARHRPHRSEARQSAQESAADLRARLKGIEAGIVPLKKRQRRYQRELREAQARGGIEARKRQVLEARLRSLASVVEGLEEQSRGLQAQAREIAYREQTRLEKESFTVAALAAVGGGGGGGGAKASGSTRHAAGATATPAEVPPSVLVSVSAPAGPVDGKGQDGRGRPGHTKPAWSESKAGQELKSVLNEQQQQQEEEEEEEQQEQQEEEKAEREVCEQQQDASPEGTEELYVRVAALSRELVATKAALAASRRTSKGLAGDIQQLTQLVVALGSGEVETAGVDDLRRDVRRDSVWI